MKRTPPARAIIYAGILGGLSHGRINALLIEVGLDAQIIPKSTYDIVRRNEIPAFRRKPKLLGKFIYHPKSQTWLMSNIAACPACKKYHQARHVNRGT